LLTSLLVLWQVTTGLGTNVKHYDETYKDKNLEGAGQNQYIASPKTDVVVDQSQPAGPQPGTTTLTTNKAQRH
jgi:SEL1 protein